MEADGGEGGGVKTEMCGNRKSGVPTPAGHPPPLPATFPAIFSGDIPATTILPAPFPATTIFSGDFSDHQRLLRQLFRRPPSSPTTSPQPPSFSAISQRPPFSPATMPRLPSMAITLLKVAVVAMGVFGTMYNCFRSGVSWWVCGRVDEGHGEDGGWRRLTLPEKMVGGGNGGCRRRWWVSVMEVVVRAKSLAGKRWKKMASCRSSIHDPCTTHSASTAIIKFSHMHGMAPLEVASM
ncbi:hypothetical protein OSB04_017281 [Centaurea solstitialis]|uniref:Uncharacterized protein n=1 Tax=Centaurea solstitialis TaxID=347529 RepID=A0AA38WLW0_9ASTR|nr:hypothetical protein OSB04_017281 [Centaurea solstitialis]